MCKSDTLTVLNNQLEVLKKLAKSLSEDKNPQVQKMYYQQLGKVEAVEAMIYYTRTGSTIYFD